MTSAPGAQPTGTGDPKSPTSHPDGVPAILLALPGSVLLLHVLVVLIPASGAAFGVPAALLLELLVVAASTTALWVLARRLLPPEPPDAPSSPESPLRPTSGGGPSGP